MYFNKLFQAGICLFIFLNLLPASFVRDTVDVNHFFSSVHLFEYAFTHGFQFGKDIIDNVGPYGYLHYPYIYAGGAFWSKMAWFALVCGVYAYYATNIISRINNTLEKSLIIFVVIFFPYQFASPFLSFEIIPRLTIFFSALYFLNEARTKASWNDNAHIIFNGIFYAFLTLEKASNIYYLILIILVLSIYWISIRQWRSSVYLVGSYLSGLAAFWFATGQNEISGLLNYFTSMSVFIDSYKENLGTEDGERILIYGLFYCASASVLIIFRLVLSFFVASPNSRLPEEFFRSILVAALCFLTWKHGIFRGMQSFGVFMYTMPIVFAYLCFYPIATSGVPGNISFFRRLSILSSGISRSFLCLILLLVVWSNIISINWDPSREQTYSVNHFSIIWKEFSDRFYDLVHYQPLQSLKMMEQKIEKLKQENALPPSLKHAMSSGRVDEFGSVPEIILLNDLDYRPRPIPITFIAGNLTLNEKNGLYYKKLETAPEFVLLDGDFGFRISDSLAYLSLIFNYQVVDTFKNWLVLEKRTGTWQNLELQKISESKANFGEWVPLAALEKYFLWLEVEAEPSLLGKIRRFFYKPTYVRLKILSEDGSTRDVSVSLAQLRAGFLVNPMIKSKDELLISELDETSIPWHSVKAFRIDFYDPDKSYLFNQQFKLKYSFVALASTADASLKPIDFSTAFSLIDLVARNYPVKTTKFPIDLLKSEQREDFVAFGISGVERNEKESWRWATGASTHIKFYVDPLLPDPGRQLQLMLAFKNGASIPDQSVTIRFNGKNVRHFSAQEIVKHELTEADLQLVANKGFNDLEIAYQDWNRGKKVISNDPRQLAVVFMRLSLRVGTR